MAAESHSLVLKTVVVLPVKADERCHDIRWYRSQFLQTLLLIFPWKSAEVKIHSKMASFWLVFSAKNPVKSDELILIKGQILNLMFRVIHIPVVPTENWLGVTHRDKKLSECATTSFYPGRQSIHQLLFKPPYTSNVHYSASQTTKVTSRQRPVFQWLTKTLGLSGSEIWSVWRVDD